MGGTTTAAAVTSKTLLGSGLVALFIVVTALVSISTAGFFLLYAFNVFDLEKIEQVADRLGVSWTGLETVQAILPFLLAFGTILALVYRHYVVEADVFVPNDKRLPDIVPLLLMIGASSALVFMDLYGLVEPVVGLIEQGVRNLYEPLHRALVGLVPDLGMFTPMTEYIAAYLWLSLISGWLLYLIDKGAKRFVVAGLVAFFVTPIAVLPGMVLFTDAVDKSFEVVEEIETKLGITGLVLPYAVLLLLSIFRSVRKVFMPSGGADLVHLLAGPLLLAMFRIADRVQEAAAQLGYAYAASTVLDTCVALMYLLYLINCVVVWSIAIATNKKSLFTRSCAVIASLFFTPLTQV